MHIKLLVFSCIFIFQNLSADKVYSFNFYCSSNVPTSALISINDSAYLSKSFLQSKNYLILADTLIFGINGHPLTQEAYRLNSLNSQITLLKELNLSYYRVDLDINGAGKISNEIRFKELLEKTKPHGITILPVLINANWENAATLSDIYNLGQRIGNKFASTYKSHFKYYEIGNEDDTKLMNATHDGSLEAHFDTVKFNKLLSFYNGIIKGIKTADEDAKIIISSSGWRHIGFFKILDKNQIDYDIVGYHWYSDMGDLTNNAFSVLDSLAKFDKPIWFTELNRRNGSKVGNYTGNTSYDESEAKKVAQAQWLKRYIEQLSTNNLVHAIFVYELFDQPAFDDGKGFEAPHEAYFGLVSWTKKYSQFQRKEGFYQLKTQIDEMHYGIHDFVNMLFMDFAGREPEIREYSLTLKELYKWQDFGLFVNNFVRNLVIEHLIKEKYNNLLNREPLPAEIEYWLKEPASDISRRVISKIIQSEEFWNLAGKTDEGLINNLYLKLQKREADVPGKTYWLNQLKQTSDEQAIVESILESEEYKSKLIKKIYEQLIAKEIDHQFLVNQLQNNKGYFSESNYIMNLICSKNYWDKALRNGCEKRNGTACYFD